MGLRGPTVLAVVSAGSVTGGVAWWLPPAGLVVGGVLGLVGAYMWAYLRRAGERG